MKEFGNKSNSMLPVSLRLGYNLQHALGVCVEFPKVLGFKPGVRLPEPVLHGGGTSVCSLVCVCSGREVFEDKLEG